MSLPVMRSLSVLFVALALAPSMAHLLELPHKIRMPADEYRVVQQIYRGWALLGIVVLLTLVSTLVLVILERARAQPFVASGIAFLCIVATQIVFWVYTYPVNVKTQNWTILPQDWLALRTRWEYSHAVSAIVTLLALIALLVDVTSQRTHPS